MNWGRPFLATGALYNGAWTVVLLARPDRVFEKTFPLSVPFAGAVLAVGLCFARGAAAYSRPSLWAALVAKGLGPLVFVALVAAGYLAASSWWITLLSDVVWVPPLVALLRRRASW